MIKTHDKLRQLGKPPSSQQFMYLFKSRDFLFDFLTLKTMHYHKNYYKNTEAFSIKNKQYREKN